LEDKVSSSRVVETGELVIDTIDVVRDDFASDLAIIDKGIVSKVVGTDKHRIHSRIHRNVQSLCSIGIHVLAVSKIRRNLIAHHIREIGLDASKSARRDVVTAHSSRNSIVVNLGSGVLSNVLRPRATSISGVVVCWVFPTDWRGTAVVRAKVTET
jgi:hypothetical protein